VSDSPGPYGLPSDLLLETPAVVVVTFPLRDGTPGTLYLTFTDPDAARAEFEALELGLGDQAFLFVAGGYVGERP
jgi:hypothetical protein